MATLDTNTQGATAAEIDLTDKNLITAYVCEKTGTSNNHEVVIDVSPDGVGWVELPHTITGENVLTEFVAAEKARLRVKIPEGGTSTCDVFILAE